MSLLTAHAAERIQQRAIPPVAIELLLDYGTSIRSRGADTASSLTAQHAGVPGANSGTPNPVGSPASSTPTRLWPTTALSSLPPGGTAAFAAPDPEETSMPRTVFLSSTDAIAQPAANWLVAQMTQRDLTNSELFRRMRLHGFQGTSPSVISMWRSGATPISLDTLPYLLKALGMSAQEMRGWSRRFLRAEHPELWSLTGEPREMPASSTGLPAHGRVACTACYAAPVPVRQTTREGDGWRITANPLAWGNTRPRVLVMGFRKGRPKPVRSRVNRMTGSPLTRISHTT